MTKQYELHVEKTHNGNEIKLTLSKENFFDLYELGLRVMGTAGIIEELQLNDRDARVLGAHASALYSILFETEALADFLDEIDNGGKIQVKKEMVS